MGPCCQEPTTVFTQLQQRREHAVRHIPSCRELLWHSLTFNHNLRNALWRKFLGLCGGFQNPVTDTSRKPTKNPHTFKLVQRKFLNQTQRFHTKAHRYAVENPSEKIFKFFLATFARPGATQRIRGQVALPHPTRLSSGTPGGTWVRRNEAASPGARGQVSEGRAPHSPSVSLRRPPRPPAAARASRRRRAGDP